MSHDDDHEISRVDQSHIELLLLKEQQEFQSLLEAKGEADGFGPAPLNNIAVTQELRTWIKRAYTISPVSTAKHQGSKW